MTNFINLWCPGGTSDAQATVGVACPTPLVSDQAPGGRSEWPIAPASAQAMVRNVTHVVAPDPFTICACVRASVRVCVSDAWEQQHISYTLIGIRPRMWVDSRNKIYFSFFCFLAKKWVCILIDTTHADYIVLLAHCNLDYSLPTTTIRTTNLLFSLQIKPALQASAPCYYDLLLLPGLNSST
jgi:hypothetical protein